MIAPLEIHSTRQCEFYPRGQTPYIRRLTAEIAKRKVPKYHGRGNHRRLTDDQVRFIRKSYEPYKTPMRFLAEQCGCAESVVKDILNGKNYKDVE